jgi:hypothetical protein
VGPKFTFRIGTHHWKFEIMLKATPTKRGCSWHLITRHIVCNNIMLENPSRK